MCTPCLLVSYEIHIHFFLLLIFLRSPPLPLLLLMINAYFFLSNYISFVVRSTMCVCHARDDAITLSFITYYRRQLGRATLSFNLSRLQFYDFSIYFFLLSAARTLTQCSKLRTCLFPGFFFLCDSYVFRLFNSSSGRPRSHSYHRIKIKWKRRSGLN